MKTFKIITSVLLALSLLLSAVGCVGDRHNDGNSSNGEGINSNNNSSNVSGVDSVEGQANEPIVNEPVVEKPVINSKQEKIALYQKIVDGETAWIASMQLSNGALPMNYNANSAVTLNPYFSDFAALALLEKSAYYSNVKKYCEWHFEHLNTSKTDYNGLDGTIYDYTARLENGKIVSETINKDGAKGHYDSVDSYAATFLCVLDKYYQKSKDAAYLKSREKDIKRVVSALLATFDGKLTTTKPDYQIQYLMDNCEVYEGLLAAANLYKGPLSSISGAANTAKDLENKAKTVKEGIEEKLWNSKKGYYETAISPNGTIAYNFEWSNFYPCATSQLFLISSGILEPTSNRAKLLYKKFNDNFDNGKKQQDWSSISMPSTFFWGSIPYAAALMGDDGRVEEYMKVYTKAMRTHTYPLYNADAARVCLAAAVMLEKLK